jgi:hypothetical protein
MPQPEPWRPPPFARVVVATLLSAAAACHGAPSESAAESGAEDASHPAAPASRRPTQRHYLGRTRERCEVYSVDGDAISAPTSVTCPADLQVGERIRLSGRSCIRESPSDPTRNLPLVCPGPLLTGEQAGLAARDAGP